MRISERPRRPRSLSERTRFVPRLPLPVTLLLASALVAATTTPPAALAQGGPPRVFAIRDARVVVAPGKTLERGTVVLRDGLIATVGADAKAPADARIIDGRGLTVYPGLVDGLSRVGMPAAADYPAARGNVYPISTVRAENDAPSLMRPDAAALAARRRAGFGAALVAPTVGMFSGTSAVFSLGASADPAAMVIRTPVAMHLDFGAPNTVRSYPGSLMGRIAVTRQALLDAADAARRLEAYEKSPLGRERPVVSRSILALRPVVEKKLPLVMHANSAQDIRRVLKIAKEFGLTPVIEGAEEAHAVTAELKAANAVVLLSASLPEPPRVPAGEDDPSTLQGLRRRALAPRSAAALAKAGVPFALTTEGLSNPSDFYGNVRRMIAAGLSVDAALEAATIAPSRLLGVEKQLGTLEPGKIANIVVTEGDLFGERTRIRHVFVDGEKADLTAPPAATQTASATGTPQRSSTPRAATAPPPVGNGPVPPLPPSVSPAFVLRGATVWTVGPQGILKEADVYVKDGKVAAVGQGLKVPSGTQEIDARGKHVTPGLIDCHSHTAIAGGVNEGTNIVTAECRIEDVIDAEDENIYRQLAGGTTAANLLHGSANAIGGQNAVVKWRWGKTADELLLAGAPPGIKFALGENPKRSNSTPRPDVEPRYPTSRMGVEKVIREAFLRARDYRAALIAYRQGKIPTPPRRDLQLDALVEILDGKRLVHCHSYRQDEILMMTRLAEEFGFKMATFQHVLEGYKVADELAKHGAGASTFSDWWAFKIEAWDAIPYNGALMAERGVVVSFNSDSSELARRLNLEAAKAIHWGGLSPEEAIKLVTLNPAKQLGVADRIGSLEPGKDADLVVWSGDPLSSLSICEKTFVDGSLYFDRGADLVARAELEAEKKRLAAAERPAGRALTPASGGALTPRPSPADGRGVPGAGAVSGSRGAGTDTVADTPLPPAGEGRGGRAPARPSPLTAIIGGTVHPISGPPIENGVVLMENGKITAVGAAAAVSYPAGTKTVDATGLHVYPGLIDADTQLGITEINSIRSTIDAREMGPFNPELRAAIAVNPDSELIPVARANGILHAMTAPSGGTISGMGALLCLDGWTWEDMAINPTAGLYMNFPLMGQRRFRETAHHCEEGAGHSHDDEESDPYFRSGAYVAASSLDTLALRYGLLPETALGAAAAQEPRPGGEGGRPSLETALRPLNDFLDEARRYRTARQSEGKDGVPTVRVHDPRLEAMLPVLDGRVPFFIRADRERDIRSAVAWAKREGFRMVLVSGQEADKCADLLARENVPVILGPTLNLPRRADAPYDDAYTIPQALAKAGVKFCLSTGDAAYVRRLPYHAAMAAAYGLPADEALKAITLYPAQILGVADRIGSLEPGKNADLILTTGNPLEITSVVKAAFCGGEPVDLSNKHLRLYEKYKSRPKK